MILPDGESTAEARAEAEAGRDGEVWPVKPRRAPAAPDAVPEAAPSPSASRLGEAQGTIGRTGGRLWLYPKESSGRWTRYRTVFAWALLSVYLAVPWLRWNGEPLFVLDVFARRLTVFSRYYWAQDLALFLPAALGSLVVVFLVTARFGRIWCGWACPQTVFLQFLFMPLERLVEGRASARRERDRHPFTPDWLWRKTLKHLLFAVVAGIIGNTALAYLWGMDNLLYAVRHPSGENAMGLAFVAAFSAVFYWVFAWFREQACIMVCPYARLQSVLVDERTFQVAYDAPRGEPRGRGAPAKRADLGDCVDCNQCVLVCPTGIDIRDGLQLECLGCMRCVDACDTTMTARKRPTGLVRYASLAELQGKAAGGANRRLIAYGLLAAALFGASAAMLLRRDAVGVDVTRRGQAPYEELAGGTVRNTFTLHMRNRRAARVNLTLRVEAPAGSGEAARVVTNWEGRSFGISGGQLLTLPLEAALPASAFRRGRLDARLIVSGDGLSEEFPLTLAGPWRMDG